MDRIEINPEVCNGKAVIKNTRIAVSTILGFLSAGDSIKDVLDGYPQLTKADVLACIAYAQTLAERHSTLAVTA